MDKKVKELAKFHKNNPGVLQMLQEDCPGKYGLIQFCGSGGESKADYCIQCWEMAIEAIKDE